MPVQLAENPADAAGARARFFNSGNAFNIKLPAVPGQVFTAEPARALGPDAPTGFVACDQAAAMECPFPATTPLMLARYATIAEGDTLTSDFSATGSIWYVIEGSGTSRVGGETLHWSAGDVFLLPGGAPIEHTAATRAVLWTVSNEPQLALDAALAPAPAAGLVEPVHYPAAEIERQIARIYEATTNENTSGLALIFSSDRLEAARNILPTLTLSLNTLPSGEHQRAHRHNSAAITLVVRGEACFAGTASVPPGGGGIRRANLAGRTAILAPLHRGGTKPSPTGRSRPTCRAHQGSACSSRRRRRHRRAAPRPGQHG
jgi:hypothetical protein